MPWLVMFGPYFLTIAILIVLHFMDRRHGYSRPGLVGFQRKRDSAVRQRSRRVA
jgi:hypothetical protein